MWEVSFVEKRGGMEVSKYFVEYILTVENPLRSRPPTTASLSPSLHSLSVLGTVDSQILSAFFVVSSFIPLFFSSI